MDTGMPLREGTHPWDHPGVCVHRSLLVSILPSSVIDLPAQALLAREFAPPSLNVRNP